MPGRLGLGPTSCVTSAWKLGSPAEGWRGTAFPKKRSSLFTLMPQERAARGNKRFRVAWSVVRLRRCGLCTGVRVRGLGLLVVVLQSRGTTLSVCKTRGKKAASLVVLCGPFYRTAISCSETHGDHLGCRGGIQAEKTSEKTATSTSVSCVEERLRVVEHSPPPYTPSVSGGRANQANGGLTRLVSICCL
jgi:hypothetical protein